MSLPIGRGSRQVRSCGLMRKRDSIGRIVEETKISAYFIDILLRRCSRGSSTVTANSPKIE